MGDMAAYYDNDGAGPDVELHRESVHLGDRALHVALDGRAEDVSMSLVMLGDGTVLIDLSTTYNPEIHPTKVCLNEADLTTARPPVRSAADAWLHCGEVRVRRSSIVAVSAEERRVGLAGDVDHWQIMVQTLNGERYCWATSTTHAGAMDALAELTGELP